jgi:hypothetical protein
VGVRVARYAVRGVDCRRRVSRTWMRRRTAPRARRSRARSRARPRPAGTRPVVARDREPSAHRREHGPIPAGEQGTRGAFRDVGNARDRERPEAGDAIKAGAGDGRRTDLSQVDARAPPRGQVRAGHRSGEGRPRLPYRQRASEQSGRDRPRANSRQICRLGAVCRSARTAHTSAGGISDFGPYRPRVRYLMLIAQRRWKRRRAPWAAAAGSSTRRVVSTFRIVLGVFACVLA